MKSSQKKLYFNFYHSPLIYSWPPRCINWTFHESLRWRSFSISFAITGLWLGVSWQRLFSNPLGRLAFDKNQKYYSTYPLACNTSFSWLRKTTLNLISILSVFFNRSFFWKSLATSTASFNAQKAGKVKFGKKVEVTSSNAFRISSWLSLLTSCTTRKKDKKIQ